MAIPAAWVLGAYLLGSIPFSFLVPLWLADVDVRGIGSGNVGATNALRAGGPGVASLSLAGDLGKGIGTVVAARWAGTTPVVTGLVAAAVVIGHVYPLYLGFRGGKGVATAAGALGALAPGAFGLSLLVFVLVVFWTRFVSLGSILAVSSFPLFVWMLSAVVRSAERDPEFVATATLIPILVLWRHRGNIARLRRGTERRLGGQA